MAWGTLEFDALSRWAFSYEDVCLGAEQHDIGWLEWEQSPTLNPPTGRPHGFRDLRVAPHTAIWQRGTELALAFGRYPALLVSLHGTGLYANFAGAEADAAIVRDFLGGQLAIQQRLTASLRSDQRLGQFCDPAIIERNRRLVRTADRMFVGYLASGMQDLAVRTDDPHSGMSSDRSPLRMARRIVRLRVNDGDLAKVTVSPWPFAAARVQVACEGMLLPSRKFGDSAELQIGLQDAARVVLAAELTPG